MVTWCENVISRFLFTPPFCWIQNDDDFHVLLVFNSHSEEIHFINIWNFVDNFPVLGKCLLQLCLLFVMRGEARRGRRGYFQSSSSSWKLAECFCAAGPAGRNESCLAQRRMSGKWIGYLWATFFAILNLQLGLMYQPGPGEPARSCRIKILSLPSAYCSYQP